VVADDWTVYLPTLPVVTTSIQRVTTECPRLINSVARKSPFNAIEKIQSSKTTRSHVKKQGCRIHSHRTAPQPPAQTPINHPPQNGHTHSHICDLESCMSELLYTLFPYISVNIFTATASSLAPTPARSDSAECEPLCGACVLEFFHSRTITVQRVSTLDNKQS
jgi:hypothetical protein